jgi:DNA-binding transcriptional ArsR family regulator
MTRVETVVVAGEGFELLVQAAALADPAWRPTFRGSPAFARRLLADQDDDAALATVGRTGWLNLMPLLLAAAQDRTALGEQEPYGVEALLETVRSTCPRRLHRILLGGERRHVTELVGPDVVDRAVTGDARAEARLREVLAGDAVVVSVTEQLLSTPSARLHADVCAALERWRDRPLRQPADAPGRHLRRELDDHARSALQQLDRLGVPGYLERTAPGLNYHLSTDDRLALVVCPSAAPIVVVVDDLAVTVMAHPPAVGAQVTRPADRLVALGRAVGDETRHRLLELLADGEQTAAGLAESLAAPRTTLLHHLAILRSTGLVEVHVVPGSATVYRLRPDALAELAALADGLVTRR